MTDAPMNHILRLSAVKPNTRAIRLHEAAGVRQARSGVWRRRGLALLVAEPMWKPER
jgi:hypothetical protein